MIMPKLYFTPKAIDPADQNTMRSNMWSGKRLKTNNY